VNDLSIIFAPLLPVWLLVAVTALTGLLVFLGIFRKLRGSLVRFLAWALLAVSLTNPSLLQEEREPQKSIIALVVDETDSQKLDGRDSQTEAASAAFRDVMQRFPQFEVRETATKTSNIENADASTALFGSLKTLLQDVPRDQIGGAVFITDGQVHDIPNNLEELGFDAPLHGLITGDEDDKDRRIVIKKAPRFGIVGESQEVIFEIEDTNIPNAPEFVDVRVLMDGELFSVEQVVPGEEASFFFDVPHGGKNIIEFEADIAEGELTPINNRAFAVLEGIRENLRVLLVSGEPHAGERTWRNLLKSDASVDLVHFTILRPPEKQDGTPINQLSLIAFPTRELFIEKIDEFDLIIFDRYQRRRVLPLLYFDNIARYLTDGGAILVAAGPEHAQGGSIHGSPLASVLPVEPTGRTIEAPFKPKVSDAGRRHPVTRNLPGMGSLDGSEKATWSNWFRIIDGQNAQGDIVMEGGNGEPLLVLNRPGEGRIAMLMSDHVWLWARGYEGGGPHTQLLRRLGHWLMKEPELDEEALRARVDGNIVTIERQTMGDAAGRVDVVGPDGVRQAITLTDRGDGLWSGQFEASALGLYRLANGDLTTLANVGPSNPREFAEIVSSTSKLASIAAATKGSLKRLARDVSTSNLPRIVPVRGSSAAAGRDWVGFKSTGASRLIGITQIPLFAGFLGLGLLLLVLASTWAREGR